ncbi:MAG: DUF3267 domain-containing protein [Spirochaetales bacterium]|nr:DUF3267 domain-containing protein [Spirochaetales bacterium]
MENYYRELPQGYREVMVVDAKDNKKVAALFTVCSFVLGAIAFLPILINLNGGFRSVIKGESSRTVFITYLVAMASFIAYIILHELVHGAAYRALTHQKLTFGLTLTVAFCGVPDVYTSRKTALIALAAPFLTFNIILIPLVIWLHSVNQLFFLFAGILFALHFGGCIGDLYMMYILLFKYKDPRTLMNDTGPKQTIYIPEN